MRLLTDREEKQGVIVEWKCVKGEAQSRRHRKSRFAWWVVVFVLTLLAAGACGVLATDVGVPEMDVTGGLEVSISDGDTTPTTDDDTDFGDANVAGGTVDHTFKIHNTNTATADLHLSGIPIVDITGVPAGVFSVKTAPISPVATDSSTTFVVTFNPSAVGLQTASVSIANDDPDENPYDFVVQGTGIAPEIDVTGRGVSISDGDTTPTTDDDTDFGSLDVIGSTAAHTFTIRNTGTAALTLTGAPLVDIIGAPAGDFVVTAVPTSPVAEGAGTTTFDVTFNPTAEGLRTATVRIANDDLDETPYEFAIQGTGFVVSSGGGGGPGVTSSAPTATTNPASDVGRTSATMHGYVDANGAPTTVTFQYGAENGINSTLAAWSGPYTHTVTAIESPLTGSNLTAVSAVIEDAVADTIYHYRVAASNAYGTAYGVDRTFTTEAVTIGDVHDDGVLDLLDVWLSARIAVGDLAGTAAQRERADVDGDGDVDMDDVSALSEYVLGIRTNLPREDDDHDQE